MKPLWALGVVTVLCLGVVKPAPADTTVVPVPVTVGSKAFTESVILGEILARLSEQAGHPVVHKKQLGGTRILWNALLSGAIDAYPDYTGTLMHEILAKEDLHTPAQLRRALAQRGLRMTGPLGFNNTYAIAVRESLATRLRLVSVSDLRAHPALALGFGNEFMHRADGWPGLQQRYRLPQRNVRGLNHDLAYRAIAAGTLQAIDVYSTDAEIAYYDLRVLKDDLHYFPDYSAVVLYRADLEQRAPNVVTGFGQLAGRIDDAAMRAMNAQVKLQSRSEASVAAAFLQNEFDLRVNPRPQAVWQTLWRHTREHLTLVGSSLSTAILFAVPLGILAARNRRAGQVILGLTGVIQTIPTLALFVFMIPLLGIGALPALAALFLYSLLPIVRGTHTGLQSIAREILDSAEALGLPPMARLRLIELPLAARSILAGIKTSAVINVGAATIGALIGAGGYGEPILTGIRLDDVGLILQGAVPAALMALLVQGLFEALERGLLPRSLRASAQTTV